MNYLERNKRMNDVLAQFNNIHFTEEQLKKLEDGMGNLVALVISGPDCKFEDTLHNYVSSIKKLLEEDEKEKLASVKLDGPIYGVPWIEIDFGESSEGWVLFTNLKKCINETKKSNECGVYSDGTGYLGPERPLHYYELPVEGLDYKYVNELKINGIVYTTKYWHPKYTGNKHYIKE